MHGRGSRPPPPPIQQMVKPPPPNGGFAIGVPPGAAALAAAPPVVRGRAPVNAGGSSFARTIAVEIVVLSATVKATSAV